MVCFQTKNTNLGKFQRALECWYVLWSFRVFYSHLVYFMVAAIWYIFPRFWYIVSRKIWQPWGGAEREILFLCSK
jgi:hypothetical protein